MTSSGDLETLFDRRSAVVTLPITPGPAPDLFPEEQLAIVNAAPKRRNEFVAGRRCAHLAMTRLGLPGLAVAMARDRAPIWPQGLAGSISHTDSIAAAVVARQGDGIRSLGLDMEPALPLPEDVLDTVLLPEEERWLDMLPAASRLIHGRLIFSAKEAFFKCQYSLSGTFIDFQAVAIRLDIAGHSFEATLTQDAGIFPAGQSFAGRFHLGADLIAAGMMLEG